MGTTEATELELYVDNDADLHRQMVTPIHKNLATKKVRSQYKHDLAVKAFMHLMEAGAKKYAKEFGGTWNKMFDVPTRKTVAEKFAKSFETEFELGNYDHLLPKKYQKEFQKQHLVPPRHHARTKLHESLHEPSALRAATDRQLRGFYREEKRDVEKARAEARRRGLPLHARKKSSVELQREIDEVLGRRRNF